MMCAKTDCEYIGACVARAARGRRRELVFGTGRTLQAGGKGGLVWF